MHGMCLCSSAACPVLFCCRFAHYFASPLLKESCLNRETEAVDSGECRVVNSARVGCVR